MRVLEAEGVTLTISMIGGNWCAGEYARNVASEVAS